MGDDREAEDAFAAFVRAQAAGLVNLAAHLYRLQPADAEDVAQVALVRTAARWPRLDDPLAYARRCVVTIGIDRHRRLARRPAEAPVDPTTLALYPVSADAGSDDRLDEALNTLPLAARQILVLRYDIGLTEAETAATLGRPIGTVKSTAHRGLAHLRRVLAASPATDGDHDALPR